MEAQLTGEKARSALTKRTKKHTEKVAAVTMMLEDHAASVATPRWLLNFQEQGVRKILLQQALAVVRLNETLQWVDEVAEAAMDQHRLQSPSR